MVRTALTNLTRSSSLATHSCRCWSWPHQGGCLLACTWSYVGSVSLTTSFRWWERQVLGSVTYYNDISVTHEDEAVRGFFALSSHRHLLCPVFRPFEMHFCIASPCPRWLQYMRKHYEFDNDRGDMYFVRTDPDDSEVLEMSFNLSNYQKQLQGTGRNVYQSIFLNDEIKDRWTWNEIDEDKVSCPAL